MIRERKIQEGLQENIVLEILLPALFTGIIIAFLLQFGVSIFKEINPANHKPLEPIGSISAFAS